MIAFRRDDRAVSFALTHALTLGIATILVAALLISGGTLLETETDRSVTKSLETTGERLAAEIVYVDAIGSGDEVTEEVTLTLEYPETAAGSRYRFGIIDGCHGIDSALTASEHCLELTATDLDDSVYIPLGELDRNVDTDRSVQGGTIVIVYNGNEFGFESL